MAAAGGRARAGEPVDVALVLAVDVSRSVDEDEARLQREGYRHAVSDPVVVRAVEAGILGALGLCYIEWAGIEYQRVVVPWTRITDQRSANAWAASLAEAPRSSLSWTSLSGALRASGQALADSPFEATRRVIDVSGDGMNNSGPPAEPERDRLVADGVTINGLPIVNERPTFGRQPPVPVDLYYQDSVIGGIGAFMIVAEDFESFGVAVKRKLIREIAGLDGPLRG